MRSLPRVLCLLWLVFLGGAIWGQASRTTQPPIFDASDYYHKAQNFWEAVQAGRPFNPLNIPPTRRAPGTVLMSYPLGFSRDFRPFFFRSVYLGVLLTSVAAYLAALPAGPWTALIVAVFMSTLPGFFHFEWPDSYGGVGYWGLADGFHAGVAALAVACSLHSVRQRSLTVLCLGAALSAFCLLIKPTGLVIMALFALTWLLLSAARGRPDPYLLRGTGAIALIYALTCIACLSSEYLSPHQIDFEARSFASLRANKLGLAGEPWSTLPWVFLGRSHACLGDGLLLAMALSLLLAPRRLRRQAVAALMVLAAGLLVCFHLGGLQQFRLFLVFGVVAAILCVPLTAALAATLPPTAQAAVASLALLPSLGLGWALLHPDTSATLQSRLGIEVGIGRTRQAEDAAARLVHETAHDADVPTLYSMTAYLMASGPFGSASLISDEGGPDPFVTVQDSDMFRPFVLRLQDMMSADYILCPFEGEPQRQDILKHTDVVTFLQEELTLAAWLSGCGPQQGVTALAAMPGALLLRVTQPTRFDRCLQDFVGRYHWRPAFTQENPRHWIAEAEVPRAAVPSSDVILDNTIHIRAVTVDLNSNPMQVTMYWHYSTPPRRKYTLYLEARTKDYVYLSRAFMKLSAAEPPDASHPIRVDRTCLNVPTGASVADLLLVPIGGRWSPAPFSSQAFLQKPCLLHIR